MSKDEGLLPTLLITALLISDEGTVHDELGPLASSLLLFRVGVSMHIYSTGHSSLPAWSVTTIFQLAMRKNGVFVIHLIEATTM